MTRGRLLHPVPVTIEQISRGSTIYDEDFREPVQIVDRSDPVTIPGQVNWGIDKNFKSSLSGAVEGSDGYVVFDRVALAAAGITLKREDRITSLGNYACDVYITGIQPFAHYVTGPTLLKAYFKERQETDKNP